MKKCIIIQYFNKKLWHNLGHIIADLDLKLSSNTVGYHSKLPVAIPQPFTSNDRIKICPMYKFIAHISTPLSSLQCLGAVVTDYSWHETLALSSEHDTITQCYFNVGQMFTWQINVRATYCVHFACPSTGPSACRQPPLFQLWDSVDHAGPTIRQRQSSVQCDTKIVGDNRGGCCR